MRLIIKDDENQASYYTALYVCKRIIEFSPTAERPFVIGILDEVSLVKVYRYLVSFSKKGFISFEHIVVFISDEFVGLPLDHPASNYTVLHENFFKYINIQPKNIFYLDGLAPNLHLECSQYEDKISKFGGIELILGSVQPDGHLAFNEPGSSIMSKTRIKTLSYETILENASFFGGDVEKVPKLALTIGVKTILDAREVVILITGAQKALTLSKCIDGSVNHMWIVSAIQLHPSSLIVCDEDATLELLVKTVRYCKNTQRVHDELNEFYNIHLNGSISTVSQNKSGPFKHPRLLSVNDQNLEISSNESNQSFPSSDSQLSIPTIPDSTKSNNNSDEETDVEIDQNDPIPPNTMVFIGGHTVPIESNNHTTHTQSSSTSQSQSQTNNNNNLYEYPRMWWEYMDQFNHFYNAHFVNCQNSFEIHSHNFGNSIPFESHNSQPKSPAINDKCPDQSPNSPDNYLDD
ncbi:Glucosamine-6-phosphate isomerase 2 [Smittium culicis]|uniref:glucosamine-6-phosphate deaminase n=1 Tax=Smittium culicis TaxID=133412 RepID=A0A1R1XSX7_9FUNG|nr:Glucosamine-6-phosphate isomerase 2 [Smittium culicis]